MELIDGIGRGLGLRARIAGSTTALAAVLASGALTAAPALAYHDQGRPWPGHVITYHNDFPADVAAVRAAVRDWNRSGAAVRFVPVPAARAEVTIQRMPVIPLSGVEKTPGGGSADALGYATVGAIPRTAPVRGPAGGVVYGAHVWLARVGARDRYGVALSVGTIARVAAHEFGHVLGLGHSHRACSVMQPILNEGCGIRHPWIGLCNDPLEPDDIRGAVSLYGGHEPRFHKHLCVISPRPLAPFKVSAALANGNAETVFRWKDPRGVTLKVGHLIDPYALDGRSTIQAYEIQGSQQGCPTGKGDVLERQEAHAKAWEQATLPLPPGTWCLRVSLIDAFRRFGPAVTLTVNVPAPGQPSPPVPNFQIAPAQPRREQQISFLNESTAGSAAITAWAWNFGDGATSTAQDPQHSYANPGTYTVTLQATDAGGQTATVTEQINVA